MYGRVIEQKQIQGRGYRRPEGGSTPWQDISTQHRRAGVYIGGTFTDLIVVDDLTGDFVVNKTLSTPRNPSQASARATQPRSSPPRDFATASKSDVRVDGGLPGARGEFRIDHQAHAQPKTLFSVPPHACMHLNLPGGGGYGDLLERNPQAVLQDVIAGYVSIEAAERDYGVVIRYLGSEEQLVRLPKH